MRRVLYHAPCPDGAAAAFVTSLYFERSGIDPLDGKCVSWHPMKVFLAPEEQFNLSSVGREDEVFVVDYCGSVDFTLDLAARARSVTVLDHHLTAVSAFTTAGANGGLPPNLHVELDMQRSGATVALDYFARRLERERPPRSGAPARGSTAAAAGKAEAAAPEPPPAAAAAEAMEEDAADTLPGADAEAEAEGSAAAEGSSAAGDEPKTRAAKRRRMKKAAKAAARDTKSAAASKGKGTASNGSAAAAALAGAAAEAPGSGGAADAVAALRCQPCGGERPGAGGYGSLLGEGPEGSSLLRFLRFIEDGDLYRFWLQDSKQFSAGFARLALNFDLRVNPGLFAELRSLDFERVVQTGRASMDGDNRKIEEEMARSFLVNIAEVGVRCRAVRTSYPELRSALGHALADRSMKEGLSPLGIVAYTTPELERKGFIKVSARAVEGGDTLRFTEKFGGGGHQAASSCNVLKFKFDNWCED